MMEIMAQMRNFTAKFAGERRENRTSLQNNNRLLQFMINLQSIDNPHKIEVSVTFCELIYMFIISPGTYS